jgi:hypothetical protein
VFDLCLIFLLRFFFSKRDGLAVYYTPELNHKKIEHKAEVQKLFDKHISDIKSVPDLEPRKSELDSKESKKAAVEDERTNAQKFLKEMKEKKTDTSSTSQASPSISRTPMVPSIPSLTSPSHPHPPSPNLNPPIIPRKKKVKALIRRVTHVREDGSLEVKETKLFNTNLINLYEKDKVCSGFQFFSADLSLSLSRAFFRQCRSYFLPSFSPNFSERFRSSYQ